MMTNKGKDSERFTKMGGKATGGKKYQRKTSKDKYPTHKSFKILEEEEENNVMNQASEDNPAKKEKDASMEDVPENNKLKEDLPSFMELGRDHEMTPSEVGIEDHELQDILERENLDLENFLEQGTTKGVDSIPQEEFDRVQQLFLWRSRAKCSGVKRNHDSQENRGV